MLELGGHEELLALDGYYASLYQKQQLEEEADGGGVKQRSRQRSHLADKNNKRPVRVGTPVCSRNGGVRRSSFGAGGKSAGSMRSGSRSARGHHEHGRSNGAGVGNPGRTSRRASRTLRTQSMGVLELGH